MWPVRALGQVESNALYSCAKQPCLSPGGSAAAESLCVLSEALRQERSKHKGLCIPMCGRRVGKCKCRTNSFLCLCNYISYSQSLINALNEQLSFDDPSILFAILSALIILCRCTSIKGRTKGVPKYANYFQKWFFFSPVSVLFCSTTSRFSSSPWFSVWISNAKRSCGAFLTLHVML